MQSMGLWGSIGLGQTVAYHITEDSTLLSISMISFFLIMQLLVEETGIITSTWIFRKWNGGARTGLIWLRIGTGGGYCKCGNEPSVSIKCGEFLV